MDKYAGIIDLFGISSPVGYSAEELATVKAEGGGLPLELEFFYQSCAASPELHNLQDELYLPNRYKSWLNSEYIVFFNENQGVCHAAVKKSDAHRPDPPVYTSVGGGEWALSSPRLSDFLCAMFDYQASICLEFNPEEFYFITPEEKAMIEQTFPRLGGFDNWLYDWNVTVYGENGGRISLMENAQEIQINIQMNYAANNKREFERMSGLLEGIGEAI